MTLQEIKTLPSLINRELIALKNTGKVGPQVNSDLAIRELTPTIMSNLNLPTGLGIEGFIESSIKNYCIG